MFSVVELNLTFLYFVIFMMTVAVPLSAFFRTMLVFFFSSVRALYSLCDRLFLGLIGLVSASWIFTLSK